MVAVKEMALRSTAADLTPALEAAGLVAIPPSDLALEN
jgi:hypothetical protein